MEKPFPDDSFLARWLAGELDETELNALEQRADYEQLKKIASKSVDVELPDFSEEKAWQKLQAAKGRETKLQPRRRWLQWVAAAASIAVLIGAWWLFRSPIETITTLNESTLFTLPDGSTVNLNTNSQISYRINDWPENRTLQLRGEAFFEVKKGSSFQVETEEGSVRVLGTSFNVLAINKEIDVYCYTGKVQVNYKKAKTILTEGESVWSNQTDTLQEKTVEDAKPTWNYPIITFDSTPLEEVFQSMEKLFKVRIQLAKIDQRSYTGFYKTNDLEAALESVCKPMNLKFSFKDAKNILIE